MNTDPTPRLLLIEDHEDLADATAEFLRMAGLEVRVAATGAEALATAAGFRPDIVVCDLNLPDMGGLDVARALRASPVTRNALFAIHTALSQMDIRAFENDPSVDNVNLY